MEEVQPEIGLIKLKPEWSCVDLVLDRIFKYLTVSELKCARLTSKAWSIAGARLLTRKTLVRLTQIVDLKPRTNRVSVLIGHCSLDSDFWECDCSLEATKKYLSIDAYVDHLETTVFDSGFVPKCVSVVACTDVWKLPLDHFSLVEKLQVVTFKPSEGLRMLNEFHLMFPNLTQLELLNIHPDEGVSQTADGTVVADSFVQVGQISETKYIRLESLTISTSAYWAFVGSSVFSKFRKLKVLNLNWSGNYPRPARILMPRFGPLVARYNFDGDLQSQWLRGAALSSLTVISIRLDLTPNNIQDVPEILNGLKLEQLSLELFGSCWEMWQFFSKLNSNLGTALTRLHWASTSPLLFTSYFENVITWLGNTGFFEKPEWSFSCCLVDFLASWSSLVKTKNQLVQQETGEREMTYIFKKMFAKYLKTDQYNYSFQRFLFDDGTAKNQFEFFSPDNLFEDKTWPYWCEDCTEEDLDYVTHMERLNRRRIYDCNCQNIRIQKMNLLCDHPAFLDEAGILMPHEHTLYDLPSITRNVSFVDPGILAKWLSIVKKSGVEAQTQVNSALAQVPATGTHEH